MPAPKPKQPIEFPDLDQHTDMTELRKEIRDVVLDLRSVVRKGESQGILVEFASVIHPGSFADPGRLPRDSTNARCKRKRKDECLFAIISTMIQMYWRMVLDPDDRRNANRSKIIRAELAALRGIASKGLDGCRIDGDDQKGYTLLR